MGRHPNPTCRAPLKRKEGPPRSHGGGHTENQAPRAHSRHLLTQAPAHLPRPLLTPQAGEEGRGRNPSRWGAGEILTNLKG